jgi:hypothetical protein
MTQAFNLSQFANKVNTSGQADLTTAVTGTLPVANGGTNQTTYTNGQLLIGNTTGNTLTKATITAGTGISVTNGAGAITIASTASGGFTNMQVFTSPGTFTTPASTTKLKVTVVAGGAGRNSGPGSNTGGTSSFGSLASATGGTTGPAPDIGGPGGAGTAGTLLLNGGNGATGSTTAGVPAIGGFSLLGFATGSSGTNYGWGYGGTSGPTLPARVGAGGGGGSAIYVGPVSASTPYAVTIGAGGAPGNQPLTSGGAGIVIVEY